MTAEKTPPPGDADKDLPSILPSKIRMEPGARGSAAIDGARRARHRSGPVMVALAALAVIAVAVGGVLLRHSLPKGTDARSASGAPTAVTYGNTAPLEHTPGAPGIFLRIHGSNTIGESLMPVLAEAFLRSKHYEDVSIDATSKADVVHVAGRLAGSLRVMEIVSAGSETGFEDLASGKADIAMASERIDGRWLQALAALGDLSSPAGEHVIALDGVSVIVHTNNPVASLTMSQLADVFSGTVRDWSEVGGAPGPISIYARNDKSGTWRNFDETVLQKFGRSLAPAARRFESSEDLSHAVAEDPRGIGFIGLTYVAPNRALGLSDTGVEARVPTACTIKTEEYLLTRRLYLYTSTTPKPDVIDLVNFATSKAAWSVVESAGMVSLDPSPLPHCDGPSQGQHSREWLNLTQGAIRLLANFNFVSGSDRLDTKAEQSIRYLIDLLMSRRDYAGRHLLLIGYSDLAGSARYNQKLSEGRAAAVARVLSGRLRAAGLTVAMDNPAGLGAQDFLAANDTPEGRERNRRVEVWLR